MNPSIAIALLLFALAQPAWAKFRVPRTSYEEVSAAFSLVLDRTQAQGDLDKRLRLFDGSLTRLLAQVPPEERNRPAYRQLGEMQETTRRALKELEKDPSAQPALEDFTEERSPRVILKDEVEEGGAPAQAPQGAVLPQARVGQLEQNLQGTGRSISAAPGSITFDNALRRAEGVAAVPDAQDEGLQARDPAAAAATSGLPSRTRSLDAALPGIQRVSAQDARPKDVPSPGTALRRSADEALAAVTRALPVPATARQLAQRRAAEARGDVFDKEGRLVKRVVREKDPKAGSKEFSIDPKTGRLTQVVQRAPDGTTTQVIRFLPGNKVEISVPGQKVVQEGKVDAKGNVQMTKARIDGTDHSPLFDEKGKMMGVELSVDPKTKSIELDSLVRAGLLKEQFLGPLKGQLPVELLQRGVSFSVSPRVLFAPGGPVLVYEVGSPNGSKSLRTFAYNPQAGWVYSDKFSMSNGETRETVTVFQSWDPKMNHFRESEVFGETYVSRYSVEKDFHSAKEATYERRRWNPARNAWVTYESKVPKPGDGILSVISKNIGWTFDNVAGYKQVGQAVSAVSWGGKMYGYTITGLAGKGIGKLADSDSHTIYGVVSSYQAIGFHSDAGGAMMEELRDRLGAQKYESYRQAWLEDYRQHLLAMPDLPPSQRQAIKYAKLDVPDGELGKFVVQGMNGQGFAGAPREFSKKAVEAEGLQAKLTWGAAAAVTYGADFTMQSLGFNAFGQALGGVVKTGKAAGTATAMGKLQTAAYRGAQAVEVTQGAYFKAIMAQQALNLHEAWQNEDAVGVTDSVAQLAGLKFVPQGPRVRKPGEFTLSTADQITLSRSKKQRAQNLWEASLLLKERLPKPVEVEYNPSASRADAYRLFYENVKAGQVGFKEVLGTVPLLIVGSAFKVPVEGVQTKNGQVTKITASGHGGVASLLSVSQLQKGTNAAAHEAGAHVTQFELLTGAVQKGNITTADMMGIYNGSKKFGYLWGGNTEVAARSVEGGGSISILAANLKLNAAAYFRGKYPPKVAQEKTAAFERHVDGEMQAVQQKFPELFNPN